MSPVRSVITSFPVAHLRYAGRISLVAAFVATQVTLLHPCLIRSLASSIAL